MIDKLGGRKFVYAMLALVSSFCLVVAGLLPIDEWIKFVEIIGGIYVVGNVGAKVATRGE